MAMLVYQRVSALYIPIIPPCLVVKSQPLNLGSGDGLLAIWKDLLQDLRAPRWNGFIYH